MDFKRKNEHVLFAMHFGRLRRRGMQNESKKSWAGGAGGPAARGVVARYREYLPVEQGTPVITLGEGSTPLVFVSRLSERVGCRVFIKCEGLNPTGSFKDRGMTVAVSKAVEHGAQGVICASTGNTSASAAAYAARAGIGCAVILPAGKIASGKLVQAIAHGARIVSIDGNFDDALRIVRELSDKGEFAIVNSINPDRIAGQKTAAFEVVDELGDAPDIHILPLGNAGNLTAYAAGYSEYRQLGKGRVLPRMIGIQAEGAAPVFYRRIIEKPETIASAIRIGNPASWEAAQRAVDDSHGAVEIVTDDQILEAQSWLAKAEGIFVEPASAAPIAGLFKLANPRRSDLIPKNATVVCTCTGHGLKDPEIVLAKFSQTAPVAPTIEAVREVMLTGRL
jgi:threonine synthase